jgi:curved DNA-binding protein CbpA
MAPLAAPGSSLVAENPFYVLGLPATATRAEIERQGQKLLGMLDLNLRPATVYTSPLGEHERTPDLVRQALSELRDPDRRLAHEVWASLPARPLPPSKREVSASTDPIPWDALAALGWESP